MLMTLDSGFIKVLEECRGAKLSHLAKILDINLSIFVIAILVIQEIRFQFHKDVLSD